MVSQPMFFLLRGRAASVRVLEFRSYGGFIPSSGEAIPSCALMCGFFILIMFLHETDTATP